ncbi:RNA helicase [Perkinsela sp. CCAP 1560/4]|nr:RNA helicase [Perkinsela sp. CCAP 1560/4]|eukprot:KNH03810.1 RNA helicase [Perkinsela sp. CCAP 1560/4]
MSKIVPLEDFDDDKQIKIDNPAETAAAIPAQAYTVALGGFKDFCLKPEIMRAIAENGFEHPSEVQHKALPQALLGNDILAQAKSGMGKTAVFVFALLDSVEKPQPNQPRSVQSLVLVHTRELAYQIDLEFQRFNRGLPYATTCVVFGGRPIEECKAHFADPMNIPAIVVGTPGRTLALLNDKTMSISNIKHFVVDEFDRCLEDFSMRRDIHAIFRHAPATKQVLMFSATMSEEMRNQAKKFMNNPLEIYVDQQSKLTLHGLVQYYITVEEKDKSKKLVEILDTVDFHQCIIFVNSVLRCEALNSLLLKCKFPSVAVHSQMTQAERLKTYDECKSQNSKILVATDLFGRGIDINHINLVIQYDMANDADSYLHRVGRAGRFGNKGLTICFVNGEKRSIPRINKQFVDTDVLKDVQSRFEIHMTELTDLSSLDKNQYMT